MLPLPSGECGGEGQPNPPPYRAQWESPGLVAEFLAGRDPVTDPLWQASGAETAAEYGLWCDHLCGCACLQMALGALGREVPPIHAIRRAVQALGGYVVQPDGAIRGLIYAGAIAWLEGQGIAARVVLDLPAEGIAPLIEGGRLFIASVHPGIRVPDRAPPSRGGHLVLVFGRTGQGEGDGQGALRFHNPSGDTPATRADAHLPAASFGRFFAGRGVLVG
jgi:hypothetical protein